MAIPPDQYVHDHRYGYGYNPAIPGYGGGFRGGIPPREKSDGARRIVCLGHSVTSGEFIVNDFGTWPAILQKRLAGETGIPTWEVFNAAVGGYGTRHILAMFRARSQTLSADLTLIPVGPGGNGLIRGHLWAPFPVTVPSDNLTNRMDKILYRSSAIYRAQVRHRIHPFLVRYAGLGTMKDDFVEETEFQGVANDIGALIDLILSRGSTPVVILFPIWEEKAANARGSVFVERLAEAVEAIRGAAAGRSTAVLDMRGIFRDSLYLSSRYFIDYQHFTTHGNGYFAKSLADTLLVQGLLHWVADARGMVTDTSRNQSSFSGDR